MQAGISYLNQANHMETRLFELPAVFQPLAFLKLPVILPVLVYLLPAANHPHSIPSSPSYLMTLVQN